jgi:hypothetical protein
VKGFRLESIEDREGVGRLRGRFDQDAVAPEYEAIEEQLPPTLSDGRMHEWNRRANARRLTKQDAHALARESNH